MRHQRRDQGPQLLLLLYLQMYLQTMQLQPSMRWHVHRHQQHLQHHQHGHHDPTEMRREALGALLLPAMGEGAGQGCYCHHHRCCPRGNGVTHW